MRTSYSALDTYKQCPQKYKFQEIDRIPAPKSKEAVFGTLVHDALKFMFDKSPLYPTLDQVLEYFRSSSETKRSVWTSETEYNVWRDEGTRMLKNFYAENAPWNFSVVDLESKFEVLIHDEIRGETHVLAGKIDRIDKLNDGTYEIIDYKTARKLPPQEKVDNDLQLSIYHLGLQKKWPQLKPEQIKLSLYFLKHGEKLSTSRNITETESTKDGVLSTINEIRQKLDSGERFEPSPSPLCDWCAYKPICPAWRHLYRQNNQQLTTDDIQPILKEYLEIKKAQQKNEERLAELQKQIKEYMDQEGLTRVFGDEGTITKKIVQRYEYDWQKVKELLSPIGKWEEVLKADETKLRRVMYEIPEEARLAIENTRIVAKEYTTLSISVKRAKEPTDQEKTPP